MYPGSGRLSGRETKVPIEYQIQETRKLRVKTRSRLSLEKLINSIGWLVVVGSALTLSAWSLYWVGRRYGLPIPLAILVSAAFDGAGIVSADLTLKYARTHGDSGFGPRLGVLTLAGMSAYLNMQHAILAHDPFAARVLYSVPPITAVTMFELHSRYERRAALKRAGRVAPALPAFGRNAWLLFPLRTLRVSRQIVGFRISSIQREAFPELPETKPQLVSGSSETLPVDSATIRSWAQTVGLPVSDRGPIPQSVVNDYMQAIESK